MKTLMTEMLGIKYPVMQGGMHLLGVPELAAAVSNAGGLGTINAANYKETNDFIMAVRRTKSLTDKPFAVNITLTPDVSNDDKVIEIVHACGQEGVKVIETAGRNPSEIRGEIDKSGMIHIHKCTTLRHAIKAQHLGVDMVTLVGYEAAGHPGKDELTTSVLLNESIGKLKIPVLAAGGICNGRSLAAMMMLGASGVVMGTRFVASQECLIHHNFKELITNADEKSTIICQRRIGNMQRCYANKRAQQAQYLDQINAELREVLSVISKKDSKICYENGNTEGCCFSMGEIAACINEIQYCKEIISGMVSEAEEVIKKTYEDLYV